MTKRDDHIKNRLFSQMSRGEPVLFLGAGFSLGTVDQAGSALPSSKELTRELWSLAFSEDEYDPNTTLGDVFHCASMVGKNKLEKFISKRFSVNADVLPDYYRVWFSMPWHTCYTLNIDNLEIAVKSKFSLPRDIQSISATTDNTNAKRQDKLQVVHLNGMIGDPIERLTFSEINYGERLSTPDAWLVRSSADMLTRPIVYVGTDLHESTLWQYIEHRRHKGGRNVRELRPGSYLITPELNRARLLLLKNLNIDWIQMTAQQFAESWLADLQRAARDGFNTISIAYSEKNRNKIPSLVSELSTQLTHKGSTEYLHGQQPTWPDLQSGRAIFRECDDQIYRYANNILKSDKTSRPLILCGTAGSGKSTALMRLALRLTSDGVPVYWIDESSNIKPFVLRQEIERIDRQVAIFVDDADLWGRILTSWATELPKSRPGVLFCAALRSSRIDGLMDSDSLGGIEPIEINIPYLSDRDIKGLIDVLDKNNRLGILKGMSTGDRIAAFQKQAGRQLLVGMIQATSGRLFIEKIYDEFREINDQQRLLYAIICVVSSQRYTIDRDELLLACGSTNNETLYAIDTLCRRNLIIRNNITTGYGARHRVIADGLIQHVEFRQWFGQILEGILFSFANAVDPTLSRTDRRWRRLIKFINHDYLIRLLSVEEARSVYEAIEYILTWDFHYWLQRGSLEVERGDLSSATNFLNQARSLANGDKLVENEYAYLQMKKAVSDPNAPDALELFNDGFNILESLIQIYGKQSPYPYHVIGSQVLAWVKRTPIVSSEKSRLLTLVIAYVKEGRKYHSRSKDLETLEKTLEREWYMMAVPRNPETPNG